MNFNLPTFVGTLVVFVIFVWFVTKFIWPPLINAMQARRERIAEGLETADKADVKLAESETHAQQLLQEAKSESQKVIDQARAQAANIVEDAKVKAREEGERLLDAARVEIEQESNRAREKLRTEISDLAILAAEQILEAEVDPKKHELMLNSISQRL